MAEMRGLHVVIVPSWWPTPEEPMSGVFCTDYARAFASAGAQVGVVFPDMVSPRFWGKGTAIPWVPRVESQDLGGVPVIRVRGRHTALRMPWIQMRRFRRWLCKGLALYAARYGRPDVLHAMCAIPAGWACAGVGDALARRVVITEHTGPFSCVMRRRAERTHVQAALDRAAAVVAVSDHGRREMRAAGIRREIEVCGNPVAEAFLTATIAEKRQTGPVRALFVGRLVASKGVKELAEAATSLGPAIDAHWHFAGDGPMATAVRARFDAAGQGDRATMHGTCDRPRLAELMRESDLLVLPTHGETFGMAVAEGLCMGLPVLTTRGTACAAFVDESNGVLVNIGEAASLAAGLRRLIGKLATYKRRRIAERARKRFSPPAVAGWYAALFRRVVDASETARAQV